MNAQVSSPRAYTLTNGQAEERRLRAQATHLREHTVGLLESVTLPERANAVDLGCGPGGALDLLSERVGPEGHVIGLDIDARNVAFAQAFAKRQRLSNVHVARADARNTRLAGSSYDLVHARFLLVNISSPEQVVGEMARLVRPGGWVAVMEPDGGLGVCEPPHRGLDRLTELLAAAYRQAGADLYLGRRLPSLLATAGLVDIGMQARARALPHGHAQRLVIPNLVQNMRATILERRLIDEPELERLDRAARLHLDDPATLSMPVTYFLTWARKPEPAS
jgi:SAM-dependent methyltransferase